MSTETQLAQRVAAAPSRGKRWLRLRARAAWRSLTARFSSSLTRRIVVLNLGGLVVLVIGFLLMDQFRADLIEARVQSLTIQADIIAAAISASATGDTDSITLDPEKLLQLAPRRKRRAGAKRRGRDRVLHQSGARGAVPASARDADPERAHLRQRRPASARLAIVFGSRCGRPLGFARRVGAARSFGSDRRPRSQFIPDVGRAAGRRSVGDQRQDDAGSRRRAAGQTAISGARQQGGRDDRVRRGADPTHDGDPRRTSTLDPGRGH